jgi:short-subunit dehydrogenase
MKVVFLGATKGMGRALARKMAERGDRLHLLGRDVEDLARSAVVISPILTASTRSSAMPTHGSADSTSP